MMNTDIADKLLENSGIQLNIQSKKVDPDIAHMTQY